MSGLLRGYGRGLVALFFAAVALWAVGLIVLPQLTMLERALTRPARVLDSGVAVTLARDARLCATILQRLDAAPAASGPGGEVAIPVLPAGPGAAGTGGATSGGTAGATAGATVDATPEGAAGVIASTGGGTAGATAGGTGGAAPEAATGGIALPPMVAATGGTGIPSLQSHGTGAGTGRPYVIQCDRANTHAALVRDDGSRAWLDETYGLPTLSVPAAAPLAEQVAAANAIGEAAEAAATRIAALEAAAPRFGFSNFAALVQPVLIPMSPQTRAAEDAKLLNRTYGVMGLRFEREGQIYQRVGLITLTRTLAFAVAATALALVICYPIAYKAALATPPRQAVWLVLALVIPYAIVELMRIYAWTAIIDNQGLLNSALMGLGLTAEPIQFKRSALTVFAVIVYTYMLFMVFPIFNVMATLDRNQIEAAEDLGASTWRLHRRVIIPHAKPGIAVGCIATFMLAAGAFSVPRIISTGLQAEWFSQTIYNKFFESRASNVGAAYSFAYTLLCFLIVAVFMRAMRARLKDFARVQ